MGSTTIPGVPLQMNEKTEHELNSVFQCSGDSTAHRMINTFEMEYNTKPREKQRSQMLSVKEREN